MRLLKTGFVLFIVLLIAGAKIFAQSTERVYLDGTYTPVPHDSMAQYYRTIVSEPDGDCTVRMYYMSGTLKMQGTYADASLLVEDGMFSYYFRNGQIESQGHFCLGQKCGIWKRWEWDGSPKSDRVYPDANSVYGQQIVESPAVFPGGYKALINFISENTVYPPEALSKHLEGLVKVAFRIDEGGLVRDVEINESGNHFLDRAALECVWEMPLWQAATRNGESLGSSFILPIRFQITEDGRGMVRVGN